jgi:hypothetical protein
MTELAKLVYNYCSELYGTKDYRYDVIVETMELNDIALVLKDAGITTIEYAFRWADDFARMQHEVELNQAWDGPESCIGSSQYKDYEF